LFDNRYKPCGPSKKGGTGTVIICDDLNLDRKVAIKFLQRVDDKRRMHDEIAALQRIRSKNVVQVFDVIVLQPGNQVGLVQEFLPGDDLRTLPTKKLAPAEYLRLLYQIASGLDDIHSQGVIHRDIKPNNMKTDQEGLVKIFDFDLSRNDGADAHTVGFRGTQGYAAPELYTFGAVAFTPAVDVYAFAATALYCAEGKLPKELEQNPPKPEDWKAGKGFVKLKSGLPKEVAALLDAALSPDPNARPSIRDVRLSLERHLLQGRHRALLVHDGETVVCDAAHPSIRLAKEGVGELTVTYDTFRFTVEGVQGDAFVNNERLASGSQFHTSCVITLGGPALGMRRHFITLDVSHPEVVL
jgi:serine/threonine-protein kinase